MIHIDSYDDQRAHLDKNECMWKNIQGKSIDTHNTSKNNKILDIKGNNEKESIPNGRLHFVMNLIERGVEKFDDVIDDIIIARADQW